MATDFKNLVVDNDAADALSRFKDLTKHSLSGNEYKMSKFDTVVDIVNEYMDGLMSYRLNVSPESKKWDMSAQADMERRRAVWRSRASNNVEYNILKRKKLNNE